MPRALSPEPVSSKATSRKSGQPAREILAVLAAWVVMSLILATLAWPNRCAPGLYYDEAVDAGLAKDFVKGHVTGTHMPGTQTVSLFGRPFPLFVQWYFGAVKPWLIIPSFMLFDCTVPVLRLTSLFWYLVGLLLFMLWVRKLLGLSASLIAAPILAFDPSFFFPCIVDWGPVIPGFLCRVGGYYLLIRWWRHGRMHDGLLGAFALGLGFFCKIDFVVILVGCGVATAIAYGKEVLASFRNFPRKYALFCLGFLVAASPMALHISYIFREVSGTGHPKRGSELLEKVNTAWAMYDGSYFFRLMNVGGRFDTMFTHFCPVWSPFGWVVIFAGILLVVRINQRSSEAAEKRRLAFLLFSTVLITLGVVLLPGAVRIHHWLLVCPFPHLIVVAAIVMLWTRSPVSVVRKWSMRTCALAMALAVIGGHLVAIAQTQSLIAASGGRGWWSDSIAELCHDVEDQRGLTLVSLDWGFNEQLLFLCDNQQFLEPLWSGQAVPASATSVYLVHPPAYALFPAGLAYCHALQRAYPKNITVRPYKDRQGNVAFYAVRLRENTSGAR